MAPTTHRRYTSSVRMPVIPRRAGAGAGRARSVQGRTAGSKLQAGSNLPGDPRCGRQSARPSRTARPRRVSSRRQGAGPAVAGGYAYFAPPLLIAVRPASARRRTGAAKPLRLRKTRECASRGVALAPRFRHHCAMVNGER